ncbi:hypothetical protein EQG63_05530 [Flavobacterium amnicola]|uniref:Uncharacterized protein n=1 Tax=Flavobacterium amnicola TaxID=2506422 RepID=A0A4Q1K2G7_9FLAO|nr:hypothetical protein [Flavobacterium amnicola]RXR18907.1 hypothetical protein EQG63_05530 [Flavobacterium amnicola]
MYSTLIVSKLSFYGAIIILILGIYLKIQSKVSNANFDYRRSGVLSSNDFIDGNGTIFLGILILLFSFIMFKVYKNEVRLRIQQKEKENL